MSLLSVEEFENVVGTGADETTIQDVIDREEAQLAHDLGGELAGEREETYRPGVGYDGPVYLRRYTDAVEVTDAGAAVTARLIGKGGAIERADGAWQGDVVVTYTPSDEARLKRALTELVRDIIVPDRDREAGTARDDRDAIARRRRAILVRDLRPSPRHGTVSVGTSHRITTVGS